MNFIYSRMSIYRSLPLAITTFLAALRFVKNSCFPYRNSAQNNPISQLDQTKGDFVRHRMAWIAGSSNCRFTVDAENDASPLEVILYIYRIVYTMRYRYIHYTILLVFLSMRSKFTSIAYDSGFIAVVHGMKSIASLFSERMYDSETQQLNITTSMYTRQWHNIYVNWIDITNERNHLIQCHNNIRQRC